MSEKNTLERVPVQIFGQRPVYTTTKQKLINLATQAIDEVVNELYEVQGDYVVKNKYVAGLFKEEIKTVLKNPNITGEKNGKNFIFVTKILKSGQGPIKLHLKKGGLHDTIGEINGGRLPNELDSI